MSLILDYFMNLGYFGIFFLMILESSIFPVPSEFVMIPAGIAAATGKIDPFIAILLGGIGSLLGALVNYYVLGRFLGRPFLEKYGKYILITPSKYKRSEGLFLKSDKTYTFVGRFIPVVRHLISIPAGIFEMPLAPFSFLTWLGATLWCTILVVLGYFYGEPVADFIHRYSNEVGYACVVLIGVYVWYKVFKK